MADSDITNLPELTDNPAVGDNLVIDDISAGVNTRTRRVTVLNLFEKYLNVEGIPAISVDSITSKDNPLPNFPDGLLVSSAAPFIEIVDEDGPDAWRLRVVGTDFIITDQNNTLDSFRIEQLAATDSLIIRADNSTEMNVVRGSDYRDKGGAGPAPFSLFIATDEINELTANAGVLIDGFAIKDEHIVARVTTGVGQSNGTLYNDLSAFLPAAFGIIVPVSGGSQIDGNDTLILSHVSRTNSTQINIFGMDGGGGFRGQTITQGTGGNIDWSINVL